MKLKFLIITIFCLFLGADEFDYTLYKKGIPDTNTVLIIGGIQGDEPGGFLAASLVALDYNITKGSVWIVPNLNHRSIIARSRGTSGDMNRKFQEISQNDPDFKAVSEIKKLINDQNVTLVLNLHDGGGFYSPTFINKDRNPNKWGNAVIIDQSNLAGSQYPELESVATKTKNAINQKRLKTEHEYNVMNTNTADGNEEMLRSLTYFAIKSGKSAFANEASKNLNAAQRTYYHLLAIEEYLRHAGIEFSRPYELSEKNVKNAIERDIKLSLFDDHFVLNLKNLRPSINNVPLKEPLRYTSDNPLVAIIKAKNSYEVRYGNRLMTRLNLSKFELSKPLQQINIISDGKNITLKSGEKIIVKDNIKISSQNGVRLNLIGFSSNKSNEADMLVTRKMFDKDYSVDKAGKIYRAEFYTLADNKFAGMILVEFR